MRACRGKRSEARYDGAFVNPENLAMRSLGPACVAALALFVPVMLAQTAGGGPYRVLRTARVGGEGGSDYIYADEAARRLYIPRGGTRAVPATETKPAVAAVPGRITIFNLDTLEPIG